MGHFADWIFCLVRTDFGTSIRQEGISFLLIDMKTPGISVRPLILMDGGHEVNEVFFDNVKVPLENLVHEEGKGWTVAKYLLGHERLNTGRVGASKRELVALKRFAAGRQRNGKPLMQDVRFADRVAELEIELMALEITNLRFLDQLRGGKPPGAGVSMLKIRGTEIQQRLTELAMEAGGADAMRISGAEDAEAPFCGQPGPALLQLQEDVDLCRVQRDPAQHHGQDDAGPLVDDRRYGTTCGHETWTSN